MIKRWQRLFRWTSRRTRRKSPVACRDAWFSVELLEMRSMLSAAPFWNPDALSLPGAGDAQPGPARTEVAAGTAPGTGGPPHGSSGNGGGGSAPLRVDAGSAGNHAPASAHQDPLGPGTSFGGQAGSPPPTGRADPSGGHSHTHSTQPLLVILVPLGGGQQTTATLAVPGLLDSTLSTPTINLVALDAVYAGSTSNGGANGVTNQTRPVTATGGGAATPAQPAALDTGLTPSVGAASAIDSSSVTDGFGSTVQQDSSRRAVVLQPEGEPSGRSSSSATSTPRSPDAADTIGSGVPSGIAGGDENAIAGRADDLLWGIVPFAEEIGEWLIFAPDYFDAAGDAVNDLSVFEPQEDWSGYVALRDSSPWAETSDSDQASALGEDGLLDIGRARSLRLSDDAVSDEESASDTSPSDSDADKLEFADRDGRRRHERRVRWRDARTEPFDGESRANQEDRPMEAGLDAAADADRPPEIPAEEGGMIDLAAVYATSSRRARDPLPHGGAANGGQVMARSDRPAQDGAATFIKADGACAKAQAFEVVGEALDGTAETATTQQPGRFDESTRPSPVGSANSARDDAPAAADRATVSPVSATAAWLPAVFTFWAGDRRRRSASKR